METNKLIEKYVEEHSTDESAVLQKLNRETNIKMAYPNMLSGKMQGNLLRMISQMVKPEKILEIGTFTGYSAICLAEGLSSSGMLHTIEINPEQEDFIRRYIMGAGFTDKVTLHIGNALDIIPTLHNVFDLVFIDADKENYLQYYHLIFEKVRKGGFILADNALWGGKVLKKTISPEKETQGIKAFNDFVQNDDRVDNLLLPLRDGMMMVRKRV